MSGKIIVFEGLDCSFKETNSKAYYEYLLSKGEKASIYHFPKYEEESSYFVREYLAGKYGDTKELNHGVVSMLYMVDMFDSAKKHIIPDLMDGKTIILDRYWYSNLYFRIGISRMIKDNILPNWICDTIGAISKILELPTADIVVKLKSNPGVMLDFVHKKNTKNDQHENNDELLLTVADVFNNINLGDYVNDKVVDVYTTNNGEVRSKDDIFSDILKVLCDE